MTDEITKAESRIAIVGAGFLGLTLALRFARAGKRVTVFESAAEIGGLASVWKIGDVVWDRHYHVTLLSDSFTRNLVGEIGLGDSFEWVETKTGFYADGKLVSMSDTLEFLKFPPLGPVGKLRLGGTIFLASRIKDWKSLERVSVEDWLVRFSGRKTFDKIWRPLLRAKLGEAYRETSAAFIWATIQRMYAARRSGLKKEMFGYVRGGYATVLTRLSEVLREAGVEIRLGSRISSIGKAPDGSVAVSDGAGRETFDAAVLTCSSSAATRLVRGLEDAERRRFESVRYQGIVCASMLIHKPLSPFYVTNIIDESPFTGIIEMTAMVDRSEFGGNSLVYLPKYVAPDDPLFERTDDEIREGFVSAIERMYPDFSRDDIVDFRISRVREVFPLPVLNYSETVPPVRTSLGNVFVVNSAQITNGTLNVNETVQLAEKFFGSGQWSVSSKQ